jgi:hypothetical protein
MPPTTDNPRHGDAVPTDPRPDFTPDWPTCTLPAGCRGVVAGSADSCLEHLGRTEAYAFINRLDPGADLDLRGTVISNALFVLLLDAFRDHRTHRLLFGTVRLQHVWFPGSIWFDEAEFTGPATFDRTRFGGQVRFDRVAFAAGASFAAAHFAAGAFLGPIAAPELDLEGTLFTGTAGVRVIGDRVSCIGARFAEGVRISAWRAEINAAGVVFGAVSSIGASTNLTWPPSDEPLPLPKVTSLARTDVSNLVLTDTDLRDCTFAGAHRLDQLRLGGRSIFGEPPPGPWTRRRVLADERGWRGWDRRDPDGPAADVGPEQVAALYRSLRKSFEDSKNEAGAGDFYYGEMEMRRHSAETPRAERWILWGYWLLSGYGQRAARAVAALLAVIATVTVLLAVWGQPPAEAAQVAVSAVVLRDPRAELTEAGQWTVMAARVLGPVLLALAVLAVRARVRR